MPDEIHDVIQVGLGPVGLTMAATLGQRGHRVAVAERHPQLYAHARVGHIDGEVMRVFQSLGVEDVVLAHSHDPVDYQLVDADREVLVEIDWRSESVSGWRAHYQQFQPAFERALLDRIEADPAVDVLQSWQALGFVDHGDHVAVELGRTVLAPGAVEPTLTDERRTVRGRYLLAIDGARSAVRAQLGIEQEDLGFTEQRLIVDAEKRRPIDLPYDFAQICDPARPIGIIPLGKTLRRWEWLRLPGESIEELQRPETAWALLAEMGLGPDDLEITRQVVYTFEARISRRWRAGRVFLVGDAAHTMPPFMGQGMCSGVRDARNLAWKLDLVLRGLAGDALLDSYEQERRPHVHDWTVISLEVGRVSTTTDPEVARARDERLRTEGLPPMPAIPTLRAGVLASDPDGAPAPLAGSLAVQAPVERDGRTALFDDAFDAAGRWQVVAVGADPRSVLDAPRLAFLEQLGAVVAHLGPDRAADARDVEGRYAAYLGEHGIDVVVTRPDFAVFGGARLADLPALVDQLAERIGASVLAPEVTSC